MMKVYYNEIEPFAAAWLRELMKAGAIPAGEVDERRIEDVQPDDVRGFDQCHFFAGIGVWAYALHQAGWGDRPVWTGSCPCQPFSQAGQQKGFDDARHLWPHWFRLIRECKPVAVFGEQVGNALPWFDLVSADLEGEGYAVGAAIMGAHSVGAPHIRQRLYFVAQPNIAQPRNGELQRSWKQRQSAEDGGVLAVADSQHPERGALVQPRNNEHNGDNAGRGSEEVGGPSGADVVGNPNQARLQGLIVGRDGANEWTAGAAGMDGGMGEPDSTGSQSRGEGSTPDGYRGSTFATGCTSGFWANAEWLWCRDGKMRPVEPLLEPMAYGLAADLGFSRTVGGKAVFFPLIEKGKNRVGRLRGYGNALCAPQAQAFVDAYLEVVG